MSSIMTADCTELASWVLLGERKQKVSGTPITRLFLVDQEAHAAGFDLQNVIKGDRGGADTWT